jgi:pyrroloquinoline quinone biosynthesis protein B
VRWYVINASPDIRQQINAFEGLSPRSIPRDTPIQAILLTNAELDHIAGLLSLRESQPLCFYSTRQVRDWILELNVVFRAICSPSSSRTWKIVSIAGEHELLGVDEKDSGLRYAAFPVPAKPPAYLADAVSPGDEGTVGYKITDAQSGRSLAYVPAIKHLNDTVAAILNDCDCFFFDGTCWSDDELVQQGLAQKTALSMGHIPISGPEGSLAKLASLRTARKIYTHLNNTNPLLKEDSPERWTVEEAGWEVAFDGMDFEV